MKTCRYSIVCILLPMILSGCVRGGNPFQRVQLPEGAPVLGEILADLSANDTAITSFRAKGSLLFQRPGVRKKDVLPQSELIFQRPDALFLKGNKLAHNVMNLTCVGDEFLLVLPLEKLMVYQDGGAVVDALEQPISPMDILREAFLPETWASLHPKQVRLTAYDPNTAMATLEVYTTRWRREVRRRVYVQGAPWVVVRNERLDASGRVVAETTLEEYETQDGIHYPAKLVTRFPAYEAQLKWTQRKIELNPDLEEGLFAEPLADTAQQLSAEGYAFATLAPVQPTD